MLENKSRDFYASIVEYSRIYNLNEYNNTIRIVIQSINPTELTHTLLSLWIIHTYAWTQAVYARPSLSRILISLPQIHPPQYYIVYPCNLQFDLH